MQLIVDTGCIVAASKSTRRGFRLTYDERLVARVLDVLAAEHSPVQRKMFGGVAIMLQGNLACGVLGDSLIVRVPKEKYEALLAMPHVREMDYSGRPMRGWVVVDPEATADDAALRDWVASATAYTLSLPPKY